MNALVTGWPHRVSQSAAFAQVAEAHLDDVHRYLLLLTGDMGLAEDLTASTFEKGFRQWRRFDASRGTEVAWLCGIARGVALDHFRADSRRRRREERYVREQAGGAQPVLGGFGPELEEALASLSAGEREVIALRIVLDLDAESAARVLGIGRSACSMRLARALAKLEERIVSHAVV